MMTLGSYLNYIIILWALLYLGAAVLIVRRHGLQELVVRYLLVYALVGVFTDFLIASTTLKWWAFSDGMRWLPVYSTAFLLWWFLALSDQFLVRQQNIWWLGIGGIWLGVLLVLWIPSDTSGGAANLDSTRILLQVLTAFTGLAFALRIAFLTLIAFNQSRQPLYKNRIVYWALALLTILIGDGLIFLGAVWLGTGLRVLGLVLATYALWSYHQASLLQVSLNMASYLLLAMWGASFYIAGYLVLQELFKLPNTFGLGLTLTVALLLLARPVFSFISHTLQHRIFGEGYDTSQVVREYSLEITNIVDIRRLSQTSLDLIAKAFEVEHGFFFLVDQEQAEQHTDYWLRPVATLGGRARTSGRLPSTNPLVRHFIQNHQPVIQYDLEVLPEFKDMATEEQLWLADLDIDVYIPICGPARWLGLLALGTKPGNSQYNTQDLLLLTTLAEQTVVALENARLVADLEEANTNLKQAFIQLERANKDLKEIDELKTSFIGVVSHEMRTPLSNVGFSLQIFERYGMEGFRPGQVEQYNELKNSVQLASLMVENLVMMASFLNNQVDPTLELIKMDQLLQGVLPPLMASAKKKEIQMKLDVIGELPPVMADKRLLANAVYQLVHNAVKFTDAGGNVWITCWATAHTICVDVKDNGKGVPADRLTEMWYEFKQMADPLKRGLEGLGLGLALVRHIVAVHAGEVWAESSEGKGSAFGFQVPIIGPKQANSPKEIFRRRLVFEDN
ncbi:MAG: GAF domain-containing sensor histidine kinase [Chloroflexota bacterium]